MLFKEAVITERAESRDGRASGRRDAHVGLLQLNQDAYEVGKTARRRRRAGRRSNKRLGTRQLGRRSDQHALNRASRLLLRLFVVLVVVAAAAGDVSRPPSSLWPPFQQPRLS